MRLRLFHAQQVKRKTGKNIKTGKNNNDFCNEFQMLVSYLQPLFLNNAKITHDDSIKFSREFMSIVVSYSHHFAKYRHNAEKQENKFVHNMCTD